MPYFIEEYMFLFSRLKKIADAKVLMPIELKKGLLEQKGSGTLEPVGFNVKNHC